MVVKTDPKISIIIINVTRHPFPPVTILPIFLCRPDLVRGMPVLRDTFRFALVIPNNLFHEKPALPIGTSSTFSCVHTLIYHKKSF